MDKLKSEFMYSISEAEKLTGINRKRIERRAKKQGLRKEGRSYVVSGEWLIREFLRDVKDLVSQDVETVSQDVVKESSEPPKTHTRIVRELEYKIQELEQELIDLRPNPNYRIEAFTNDEYDEFRKRLIEWQSQKESITHYQSQAEYQRKQADKILDIHQKLVDTIQSQNTLATQRNIIEAKDKGVINDDWEVQ